MMERGRSSSFVSSEMSHVVVVDRLATTSPFNSVELLYRLYRSQEDKHELYRKRKSKKAEDELTHTTRLRPDHPRHPRPLQQPPPNAPCWRCRPPAC